MAGYQMAKWRRRFRFSTASGQTTRQAQRAKPVLRIADVQTCRLCCLSTARLPPRFSLSVPSSRLGRFPTFPTPYLLVSLSLVPAGPRDLFSFHRLAAAQVPSTLSGGRHYGTPLLPYYFPSQSFLSFLLSTFSFHASSTPSFHVFFPRYSAPLSSFDHSFFVFLVLDLFAFLPFLLCLPCPPRLLVSLCLLFLFLVNPTTSPPPGRHPLRPALLTHTFPFSSLFSVFSLASLFDHVSLFFSLTSLSLTSLSRINSTYLLTLASSLFLPPFPSLLLDGRRLSPKPF